MYPNNPFAPSNPLRTAALMENDEEVWRDVSSLTATLNLLERTPGTLKIVGTGGVDAFPQGNNVFAPPALQFEAVADWNKFTVIVTVEAAEVGPKWSSVAVLVGRSHSSLTRSFADHPIYDNGMPRYCRRMML